MIIELGRADKAMLAQVRRLRAELLNTRERMRAHAKTLPIGGTRIAAAAFADWLGHAADDLDLDGDQ